MKNIATDSQSFSDHIRKGNIYVDKTRFIWRMVNSGSRSFFFSRPRRFGKSMVVSILENYFLGNKTLFKGLDLERLAPQEWTVHPVLHLDMTMAVSTYSASEVRQNLMYLLRREASKQGVSIEGNTPTQMFDSLVSALYLSTGKQVVVLVDEYDKPVLDVLQQPWRIEVLNVLRDFYSVLKMDVDMLRFVFITGVGKFSHTSLFSGNNNLTDITYDDQYSEMLGYTDAELRYYFDENINEIASQKGMEKNALLSLMKEWYDGFRFTLKGAHLYNPVSIGCFLNSGEFKNYWYGTGTPTFLIEQMKHNPFQMEEFSQRWVNMDLSSNCDINNINPMVLAIQTGYLTLAGIKSVGVQNLVRYDFPNLEIRQSWSNNMLPIMNLDGNGKMMDLYISIYEGNLDVMLPLLQQICAGISYENIGNLHEGYFRNMLQVIFTSYGLWTEGEVQQAQGRADLVVRVDKSFYLFEIKLQRENQDVEALLDQAMQQADSNHYADKYHFLSNQVNVIALVFSEDTRQLVGWRQ